MSVRRSAYLSFGSRNAGVAINFAASVVIARLLTPQEIGVFAVSAAFVMLSQVIRDSGIGSYLIQERELTSQRISTAMGVSLLAGSVLGLSILALAEPLAAFYGEPGIAEVLLILVFSFVLAPVNAIGLALLRRDLAFGTTFVLETGSNLVWAAVAVVLALLGASYHSMAWASLAATTTTCLMFLLLRRELILIRPSFRQWRRVFGFGSLVTLTQLINQLGVLAPALVLGRLSDFGAVAFYSRGNALTKVFRETVERGAAVVALPAFSAQLRNGGGNRQSFCYATALMTGIAWPFYGVLAILAFPIVRILFGPQWDAAVPVVQLLAAAHMIRVPTMLAPQLIIAQGRPRLALAREALVQGLRVAIVLICAVHGFLAVAAGQLVVTLCALIVDFAIVRRIIGVSGLDMLRACLPSLGLALSACIAPLAVTLFYPPMPDRVWLPLAVALAGGLAGWMAALLVLPHPLRGEWRILLRFLPSPRIWLPGHRPRVTPS